MCVFGILWGESWRRVLAKETRRRRRQVVIGQGSGNLETGGCCERWGCCRKHEDESRGNLFGYEEKRKRSIVVVEPKDGVESIGSKALLGVANVVIRTSAIFNRNLKIWRSVEWFLKPLKVGEEGSCLEFEKDAFYYYMKKGVGLLYGLVTSVARKWVVDTEKEFGIPWRICLWM